MSRNALCCASAGVLDPLVGLGEVIFVNKYDLPWELEAERYDVMKDSNDAVSVDEWRKLVFVGEIVQRFSVLQVVVRLIVGESTFGDPVAI